MLMDGQSNYGIVVDSLSKAIKNNYFNYLKSAEYLDRITNDLADLDRLFSVDKLLVISKCLPLAWLHCARSLGFETTTISDHPLSYILGNVNIKSNIYVEDIQQHIDVNDTIVFPDIEYLAPLKYFKFDLSNKNILIVHNLKDSKQSMGVNFVVIDNNDIAGLVNFQTILLSDTIDLTGTKYHRLFCRG